MIPVSHAARFLNAAFDKLVEVHRHLRLSLDSVWPGVVPESEVSNERSQLNHNGVVVDTYGKLVLTYKFQRLTVTISVYAAMDPAIGSKLHCRSSYTIAGALGIGDSDLLCGAMPLIDVAFKDFKEVFYQ